MTENQYLPVIGEKMAQPISLGLVLEGEAAKRFEEYEANPVFTQKGLDLIREVKEELKAEGFVE